VKNFKGLLFLPHPVDFINFYAWKQLLLSARLSHRNSVSPSVCLFVCHTDGSVKNDAR